MPDPDYPFTEDDYRAAQVERLEFDCEQSGHMVQGDCCSCGKVTVDIAGKEHGR